MQNTNCRIILFLPRALSGPEHRKGPPLQRLGTISLLHLSKSYARQFLLPDLGHTNSERERGKSALSIHPASIQPMRTHLFSCLAPWASMDMAKMRAETAFRSVCHTKVRIAPSIDQRALHSLTQGHQNVGSQKCSAAGATVNSIH